MNRMLGFKNGQKGTGINKLCQIHFQTCMGESALFFCSCQCLSRGKLRHLGESFLMCKYLKIKRQDRHLTDSQGKGNPEGS